MFDIFNTIFKYKEKKSPDKLGAYPERVHVNAMPERRYLWTSRFLVICATFSICFNIMIACTIYLLLPQRSSAPKLYTINDYFNELELLEPAEMNVSASTLLAEENIYTYIMLRYLITPHYEELVQRWSPGSKLYWMSSNSVFREFMETEAEYGKQMFRIKGLRRDVEIDWIRPATRGLWQVQFRTLDYFYDKDEPEETIWSATLRIAYSNISFPKKNQALMNPFGFLVKSFSLAYHGTPNTSSHYLDAAKESAAKRYLRRQ